jgi:hypothetical protein
MANTETEQLVVTLEARIDAFEKNFQKASKTAGSSWSAIESRGQSAGKRIQADMDRATAGIANSFKTLGSSLAGSVGLSGVLGVGGLLALTVKINGELARMGSLAKSAELSTDRLQEIKYAANTNGVSDDSFASSIHGSLALLDEAQRNVNSLSRLFNANGMSIRNSNGELIKFDELLEKASKLIALAPSEQAKVRITEMLGISRDWIRVLDDGPVAFRKLSEEARSAGVIVDEAMIKRAKEFDREWASATVKFKAGMTSVLSGLSDSFATFWREVLSDMPGGNFIKNVFRAWGRDLQGMTMPQLEAALADSVENGIGDPAKIIEEIDRRLGKTPLKVRIAKEVDGPPTVIPKETQKNSFDRAVFETNKRIAATDAETKTVGLNTEARERAKIVAELEEAAKKANTEAGFQNATVTDAQRQKIEKLADAMEAATKRQRVAQEQYKSFNDVLQFSGSLAVDFVDKLGDKTAKLNDLVLSAVGSLKKAVIQAALLGQGPLAGMFGTASSVSGGTGGIFGAIGSLFGGARAEGGPVSPDKAYLIGERGPEIMMPGISGSVIPNHAIGGQSVAQTNTFNVTVNGSAGTAEQNDDLVRKMSAAMDDKVKGMIGQGIRQQMRPGGLMAR